MVRLDRTSEAFKCLTLKRKRRRVGTQSTLPSPSGGHSPIKNKSATVGTPRVNLSSRELQKWSSAMRFLSKRQVKDLVTYSFAHTARLESDGKFPKRVRLGTGRVAYVESEIEEWMASRIADRDRHTGS